MTCISNQSILNRMYLGDILPSLSKSLEQIVFWHIWYFYTKVRWGSSCARGPQALYTFQRWMINLQLSENIPHRSRTKRIGICTCWCIYPFWSPDVVNMESFAI